MTVLVSGYYFPHYLQKAIVHPKPRQKPKDNLSGGFNALPVIASTPVNIAPAPEIRARGSIALTPMVASPKPVFHFGKGRFKELVAKAKKQISDPEKKYLPLNLNKKNPLHRFYVSLKDHLPPPLPGDDLKNAAAFLAREYLESIDPESESHLAPDTNVRLGRHEDTHIFTEYKITDDRKVGKSFVKTHVRNDYLVWKTLNDCKRKVTFFVSRENPKLSCEEKDFRKEIEKVNNFFLTRGGFKNIYLALRIDFLINGTNFPTKIDFSHWVLSQSRTKDDAKEIHEKGNSKHSDILKFVNDDEKNGNCRIIDFPLILGRNSQGLIESVQPYRGQSLHRVMTDRKIYVGPSRQQLWDVPGSVGIKVLFNVAFVVDRHFHANRYVHRDLTTNNILVQLTLPTSLIAYITDFDLCSKSMYLGPNEGWSFDPASKKGYVLPFADIYLLYINLVSIYLNSINNKLHEKKLFNRASFENFFQKGIEGYIRDIKLPMQIDSSVLGYIRDMVSGRLREASWIDRSTHSIIRTRVELLANLAVEFLEVFRQASLLADEFGDDCLQHPIFLHNKYDEEMKKLQQKFPKLTIKAFKETCGRIYEKDTGKLITA